FLRARTQGHAVEAAGEHACREQPGGRDQRHHQQQLQQREAALASTRQCHAGRAFATSGASESRAGGDAGAVAPAAAGERDPYPRVMAATGAWTGPPGPPAPVAASVVADVGIDAGAAGLAVGAVADDVERPAVAGRPV